MSTADQLKLLNPKQAAEFLTLKESTLAIWRCTQRYDLPFIKVGRSIAYDLKDLVAFAERRKVRCKKAK